MARCLALSHPILKFKDRTHRLIASRWPTIGVFDDVMSAEDAIAALELEAATNDRLTDALGRLRAIPEAEWAIGNAGGATLAMAAFLHPAETGGRFNSPQLGAWYAACDIDTAIDETAYHHHKRLVASTGGFPSRIQMRELLSKPDVDLIDVRAEDGYHAPDDYGPSQAFGEAIRNAGHDGIFYLSVRRRGGNNVAIYKPRRLLPVIQGDHYEYVWDAAGTFNAARLTGVR
jgi:RES domain-containing protein